MTEQPPTEPTPLDLAALLGEAMTKSGLLWIDVADDRTWPAWHVWDAPVAYVLSGPGEQPLPWLPEKVHVILRSKDTGGRLITVVADTAVVYPGEPEWDHAAELLRASRLNAPPDAIDRWRNECTIFRITPTGGVPVESPGNYTAADLRATPARTTATTANWRPWHWKGRGPRAAAPANGAPSRQKRTGRGRRS